jgi:hypothetical protein
MEFCTKGNAKQSFYPSGKDTDTTNQLNAALREKQGLNWPGCESDVADHGPSFAKAKVSGVLRMNP